MRKKIMVSRSHRCADFYKAVCAGASQTALTADEKSPSRISRRHDAQGAPE